MTPEAATLGALRTFLFAPAPAAHQAEMRALAKLLPQFSDGTVIDAAYRRSQSRQVAFTFAQGVVVGALGNLFASAVGHFIDRAAAPWSVPDSLWTIAAMLSLALMGSMTWGAVRRHRQNAEAERLFLAEVQRRGGLALEEADPDDVFAARLG